MQGRTVRAWPAVEGWKEARKDAMLARNRREDGDAQAPADEDPRVAAGTLRRLAKGTSTPSHTRSALYKLLHRTQYSCVSPGRFRWTVDFISLAWPSLTAWPPDSGKLVESGAPVWRVHCDWQNTGCMV